MKVRLKVLTIVAIVLFIITLAENIFNIYCYFNDIRTPYSLTILSNLSMVALVFTFIILIKRQRN